ncbi:MAG: hypothetical protein H0V17_04970 [Deltaproteobacteria bacterium]|nr:hypothetical protein [Deltaproteobacteria bacterium]
MGVGLYSALGDADDDVLAILTAFGDALARDEDAVSLLPEEAWVAGASAVREIREFEARVGQPCGAAAERVHTPGGPAIELGNRGHLAFGAQHRSAAEVVARALADLMTALGATNVTSFTVD